MATQKRYKKGHFLNLGIAIGPGLGVPLGLAMGNIAIGIAIGVGLGTAVGAVLEQKMNSNPIAFTEEEKRKQKKVFLISLITGAVLFLIFLTLYLIKN